MRKITILMVILALALTTVPAMASVIQIISPEADSYVSMNASTTNFGTNSLLYVGLSGGVYHRNSDLQFDLSALSGITAEDIVSVTLYLDLVYRNSATYYQPSITVSHVANDAWLENTITWANQPAVGSAMYTTPSNLPLGWVAFDLLALGDSWVAGDLTDGILSVALSTASSTGTFTPNTDYKFYSQDYAGEAYRPYLRVEYNQPVPVPPSALLLGSGLLGFGLVRFRRTA
ncbi:MAG: DNRLRE domain-containing protein [Desulfobaccales bacterium]